MKKKVIAIILSVVMTVGCLGGASVWAAETTAAGATEITQDKKTAETTATEDPARTAGEATDKRETGVIGENAGDQLNAQPDTSDSTNEKSGYDPEDKPEDNPADDSTDNWTGNPADDSTDDWTGNPADDSTDDWTGNPADDPTDDWTGNPADDPTENSTSNFNNTSRSDSTSSSRELIDETIGETLEETQDPDGSSKQSEAVSESIEEIELEAVNIAAGDEKELTTGTAPETGEENKTFYFRFAPAQTAFYTFTTSDRENAYPESWLYDSNGERIADAVLIDDYNREINKLFQAGEVYYFRVDVNVDDAEAGTGKCKVRLANSENGFLYEREGDYERTALLNSEVTLSVKAWSTTGITYQWYVDDEPVEGAVSASYTFTVDRTGVYLCRILDENENTADCDFKVNADNRLQVRAMNGDWEQDETDLHITPGDKAQMQVIAQAIDTAGLTYQWYKYGEVADMWSIHWFKDVIEGETNDTLTIDQPLTGEKYICTVEDRFGSSHDIRINIYVDNDLEVYVGEEGNTEESVTAEPGSPVELSAAVITGGQTVLTYQWYQEDHLIEGAETNPYTVESPQNGTYKCVVSDQYGNKREVRYHIQIENDLTAYAGGTKNTRDDIYVLAGDAVVMDVEVIAKDTSQISYEWDKLEYHGGILDYYYWSRIEGVDGPECTLESSEDGNEYRCLVSDQYGNEIEVQFKIHIVDNTHFASIRVAGPSGEEIKEGFTASWYSEDGTFLGTGDRIFNLEVQAKYSCSIELHEELSYQYMQPEPLQFTLGQNSTSLDLTLTTIEPVAITGTVSSKAGERIPWANVRLKQVYNGQYTRTLETQADENGAFSFDAYKTETTLIASADRYFDGYYYVPAESGEGTVSVDAVLEEIPSNRITLKLYRREAAPEGEEGRSVELENANGLEVSADNVTRSSDKIGFKMQFPYVVLDEGTADPGDVIRLSAEDTAAGMTAEPLEISLDDTGCAEAEWTFVQNGKLRIRNITGNDENIVFVFDADGRCVQHSAIESSYDSDPLPEGNYTCVLMKKTGVLRSVDTFARLAQFELSEGTDYIKFDVKIMKGVITVIDGAAVPVLDDSKFVYTVAENTRFWANRAESVTGQYVQMRLMYELQDKYAGKNVTVTVEIPEGMTFVERSLTFDGRACGCSIADADGAQSVTIPVGSSKGTIRFYVMPTTSGEKNVFAHLTFSEGTAVLNQPLGALSIGISAATIRVPAETGLKTVTASGQTASGSEVTVYDNDTAVGMTTANRNGSWSLSFDLVDAHRYSGHSIRAKAYSEEFGEIETDTAELSYNDSYVEISKVTMINTAHSEVDIQPIEFRTVFDFLHRGGAIPTYNYWPEYPRFTFVVEFTEGDWDPDDIRNVVVITTNSSGSRTRVSCAYDEDSRTWIGTHDYTMFEDVPCRIAVSCRNDTGSVYDTTMDEVETAAALEDYRNIAAQYGELVADHAEMENEQVEDGRISFDVVIAGETAGSFSMEVMDYDGIDLDRWLKEHDVITSEDNGQTYYMAYELTETGFVIYTICPEERAMTKETFLAASASLETRKEAELRASESLQVPEGLQAFEDLQATENLQASEALRVSADPKSWVTFLIPEIIKRPFIIADQNYALNRELRRIRKNSCGCPEVAPHNNELFIQAGLDIAEYQQIALGKFGAGVVLDLLLKPLIAPLQAGQPLLDKMLRYVTRQGIGEVASDLMNYEGTFNDAMDKIRGMEDKLKICSVCEHQKFCPCRDDDDDDDEEDGGEAIPKADPSGYVYEAVPSNRVSGVKAEIYSYSYAVDEFGVQEDEKSEILWDAENYDQVNPQYTDVDGTFAWDVPEGQWLVKFSKDGYEDTDSRKDIAADADGYLPVPPIQTEVNTAIVSKAAPEVSGIAAYPEEIRIDFSQYMQIASVNTGNIKVTSGGKAISGAIKPLNEEDNYEGTEKFASYYAFVPDKELSGTVTVSVSGVKNYCGKAIKAGYRKDCKVVVMPKQLVVTGSRKIGHHDSAEFTIKVLPAEAGANRTITVTSYSPSIVEVDGASGGAAVGASGDTSVSGLVISTDGRGTGKVVLNGNLPGQGAVRFSLDNTGISEDIQVIVGEGSTTESLEDGQYEISLKSEKLVYSGKPLTPAVAIEGLTENTDYTVSYENNVKPGTAAVTVNGIGNYTGTLTKTFLIVPGKTTRGDMFNLANNVKVTWKEVPGAKYYKVYREGVTDSKETIKEPVIVTTGLVGWDKQPGLTNGHAYRYRIVASLTGKGDSSGDSPLSYSKLMYRLKTVVIRSVKNTAAGKVTVKYDKTTSGDSYVLQYCERQDMVGAKTKVVLGANNTSYTIGGLKKGKTYYISIRVRKKVNGIDYYTTFGVAKKITITK